jgi:hypothetical protein
MKFSGIAIFGIIQTKTLKFITFMNANWKKWCNRKIWIRIIAWYVQVLEISHKARSSVFHLIFLSKSFATMYGAATKRSVTESCFLELCFQKGVIFSNFLVPASNSYPSWKNVVSSHVRWRSFKSTAIVFFSFFFFYIFKAKLIEYLDSVKKCAFFTFFFLQNPNLFSFART